MEVESIHKDVETQPSNSDGEIYILKHKTVDSQKRCQNYFNEKTIKRTERK